MLQSCSFLLPLSGALVSFSSCTSNVCICTTQHFSHLGTLQILLPSNPPDFASVSQHEVLRMVVPILPFPLGLMARTSWFPAAANIPGSFTAWALSISS